jgi:hypothetical protein
MEELGHREEDEDLEERVVSGLGSGDHRPSENAVGF